MRITALGHSAFLLEMEPAAAGAPVRVLADPWIEDYLAGDLLGRFPRIRLDVAALGPIDAVFLSHSHTDHLCPYSLTRLWAAFDSPPSLILPRSLEFLAPLLETRLRGSEMVFLDDGRPVDFGGVSICGFFNPETGATNEDDVMVLVARNGRETFLSECDAVLPFYHPAGRELVTSIVLEGEPETICFMTTRNEGEATMAMLAARDPDDRRARLERSIERTCDEIGEIYTPLDELATDLWQCDNLVRLVAGQGIGFPQKLDTGWNRVLFPIRLEDRVRMEREIAASLGCLHAIEELVPGSVHVVEGGRFVERSPARGVELLDREEERHFDADLDLIEDFPDAPLRDEPRDGDAQLRRIAECLDRRFLPHLIGARTPPVEHLLAESGGEYRIRVRVGTSADWTQRDFRLRFARMRFEETDAVGDADEHYWANDLEDFLDGRCDEFSTVIRHPLPARSQRLWLCLGLPYLNNDIIERKLAFHFDRAARGESLEEWVLSFYRGAP